MEDAEEEWNPEASWTGAGVADKLCASNLEQERQVQC